MNPLLVPELLFCILDCFTTPTYTGIPATGLEERKALAALARTCRTFSEPSLDLLWRRLDSLLPLIRTFADVVDDYRARKLPSAVEWRVIDRYAHRIQELTLGTEIFTLDFLQSARPALPNLKVLRWVRPFGALDKRLMTDILYPFRSFRELLNPNIDTLEVNLASSADGDLRSFMQDYASLCPNLKSIKFDFWFPGNPAPVHATEFLCSRSDWKRVDVSFPMDAIAFKHVGACSTLEAVSVCLAPEVAQPCFEQTDTPFCNVTRLALTVWNRFEVATNVLRRHGQAFDDIKIVVQDCRSSLAEFSALASALASPPRMHSLRSIVIRQMTIDIGSMPPGERVSYETLWPMTSLKYLHELVLDLNHTLSIGDDEFERLVCHWPRLRVFELTGCRGTESSLSLKALTTLVECCPDVCSAGVTLGTRRVPSTSVDVQSENVTCKLSVQDTDPVAAFLFRHLPSMTSLQQDVKATRIVLGKGQWRRAEGTLGETNREIMIKLLKDCQ